MFSSTSVFNFTFSEIPEKTKRNKVKQILNLMSEIKTQIDKLK